VSHSTPGTRDTRPVFFDLRQIRLPIGGVLSILHRITGVAMILGLAPLAWLFGRSLQGPEGYASAVSLLDHWAIQILLLVALWGLCHHLLAGVRHLLMDVDVGIEKPSARLSATVVLAGAPLLALILWGMLP
jgi:succinate dehydrogenase / fumarate reductase cytochrome b subunit